MSGPLNRREAFASLGTLTLGSVLAACGGSDDDQPSSPSTNRMLDESASCTVTPELAEGPFYFDAGSVRRDIRDGRDGVALGLALRVRAAGSCEPIESAVVDIWHCDAAGIYSGFDAGEGETFLRGTQVTNADGAVRFDTVYPGAYSGRTLHIHAKVHLDRSAVLTTQLFFDEAVNEQVLGSPPYGRRDTTNDSDGIFDDQLVMTTRRDGDGWLSALTFDVRT